MLQHESFHVYISLVRSANWCHKPLCMRYVRDSPNPLWLDNGQTRVSFHVPMFDPLPPESEYDSDTKRSFPPKEVYSLICATQITCTYNWLSIFVDLETSQRLGLAMSYVKSQVAHLASHLVHCVRQISDSLTCSHNTFK